MPITNTIKGNLVKLAQQGVFTEIGHGCNCFCVMGAGIAPQIAKAFPEAEEADNNTTRGAKEKLGSMSIGFHMLFEGTERKREIAICNLYTQYGTGGRAIGEPDIDYDALESAFTELNRLTAIAKAEGMFNNGRQPEQHMGIPMIGAGLAGGDWERIEKIINRVTPNMDITLVEYDGS